MTGRRVVVTGIGVISPVGAGADALWCALRLGESAVRPVTRFDASTFRSRLAGEVDHFDPVDFMDPRAARRMDRCAQFAVAAARMAAEDAGLDRTSLRPDRLGVSLGSALGGVAMAEQQHSAFLGGGLRGVGTTLATAVYGGAGGSNVAIELGAHGPCLAQSNSCASGAMAIGEALRLLRHGEADVVFAGGSEAPLAPLTFGAFALIHAMSTRNDDPRTAARPFDASRDGFVMSEGAAVLVLEGLDHALRRDAHIYAELSGYGQSNDAYHMTAPRPGGEDAARAVTLALEDAEVSASEIGYVNAHATGTPLGDRAEAAALRCALTEAGARAAVSGTKGVYGHMLGASGALEAGITSMALERGWLPGTANLERRDPEVCLDVVEPAGRHGHVPAAVSTSFGFGGANVALVFRAADAAGECHA